MIDSAGIDKESALHAIADMITRTEKAQGKFAVGTSQHSLLVNRVHTLQVSRALIARESNTYSDVDFERAKAPLASLISKSEKAQNKLREDSWQYRMLHQNLQTLYLARELLEAI